MITYKNISFSAKTFYGVKFAPGEVKSVPGYINNDGMVRVFGIKPAEKTPIYDSPKRTKKKANEPEKDSDTELKEIQITTSEEETSNGNPS